MKDGRGAGRLRRDRSTRDGRYRVGRRVKGATGGGVGCRMVGGTSV